MYTYLVVNETTDDNTEKCIRQLAAYGAVCLRDNNDRSPVDILLDKNRFSDAETMIQLTCKIMSTFFYDLSHLFVITGKIFEIFWLLLSLLSMLTFLSPNFHF